MTEAAAERVRLQEQTQQLAAAEAESQAAKRRGDAALQEARDLHSQVRHLLCLLDVSCLQALPASRPESFQVSNYARAIPPTCIHI